MRLYKVIKMTFRLVKGLGESGNLFNVTIKFKSYSFLFKPLRREALSRCGNLDVIKRYI